METPPSPQVTLTEAAKVAARQLAQENPDFYGLPLRLYLEGKGCDGFYYGVTFDRREDHDFTFVDDDVLVVVDSDTMEFVNGSVIDWISDERGTGFLVDNPLHKTFRGKFYKRQSWQSKLLARKRSQNGSPSKHS